VEEDNHRPEKQGRMEWTEDNHFNKKLNLQRHNQILKVFHHRANEVEENRNQVMKEEIQLPKNNQLSLHKSLNQNPCSHLHPSPRKRKNQNHFQVLDLTISILDKQIHQKRR